MKIKLLIIVTITILVILLFPIRTIYKDGGTKVYSAILYKVIVWNEVNDNYESGYKTGTEFHFFPNNFKSIDYYRDKEILYNQYTYKGYFFEFNIVERLSKKDDLSQILSKINNLSEEVKNKFNSYDEEYFKQKDLIIVYFPLGSSSITTKLKDIKVESDIELTFEKNMPEVGTADMSGYLYIIEIDKSDKEIRAQFDDLNSIITNCNFNRTYKVLKAISEDGICQVVTFKDLDTSNIATTTLCLKKYTTFEEEKLYKFSFIPYSNDKTENTIDKMFQNFIIEKVEETKEIINEISCSIKS